MYCSYDLKNNIVLTFQIVIREPKKSNYNNINDIKMR